MSWYKDKYTCGHEGKINIKGNNREKTKKDESQNILQKSEALGLSPLLGSNAQVDWANEIRLKAIEQILDLKIELKDDIESAMYIYADVIEQIQITLGITKESLDLSEYINKITDYLNLLEEHVKNIEMAKWFIDHRYYDLSTFIISVRRGVKEYIKQCHDPAYRAKIQGNTFFPNEKTTEGIAIITTIKEKDKIGIDIDYAEYKADAHKFRFIMEELNYCETEDLHWKRWLSPVTSGKEDDRIAEIAIKLIENGYAVCALDQESREKIKNRKFNPECFYWLLMRDQRTLELLLIKNNNSIYKAAMSINGAKYKNNVICIDASNHQKIKAIANKYNLGVSEKAKAILLAFENK